MGDRLGETGVSLIRGRIWTLSLCVSLELPCVRSVSGCFPRKSHPETISFPWKHVKRFMTSWRHILGLGGGSSRATTVSVKPDVLCEPSQKGLFWECPLRQREIVVRPARPKGVP